MKVGFGILSYAARVLRCFRSELAQFTCRYRTKRQVSGLLHKYRGFTGEKYCFSDNDVNLYIAEKCMRLPVLQVLGEENGNTLLRINNREFYWPANRPPGNLPWLFHEVFDEWSMNPSSYDHPRFELSKAGWILDAGACEGFYPRFVFENNFTGNLLAIEPLISLRDVLGLNLAYTKERINYEVVGKGLGGKQGHCCINESDYASNSSVCKTPAIDAAQGQIKKIEVTTIDRLIEEYGFAGNGIIKMDIEGSEMEALLGAERTIKEMKPQLAIAVYHDYDNARECARIVRSYRSDYCIEYRGMYGYTDPPRPYLMFAY